MKQSRIDFIKEAHMAACTGWRARIEKEFPKIFQQEFKVGDWVIIKRKYGNIIRLVECSEGRGIWAEELKTPYYKMSYHQSKQKNHHCINIVERKATKEEIESHLIAEAKRRGYIEGVKVNFGEHDWVIRDEKPIYSYNDRLDVLYANYDVGHGKAIYRKGQWAEIIEDPMQKIADEIKAICKRQGVNPRSIKKLL